MVKLDINHMTKYHISDDGNPRACKAVKQCRYGEAAHYLSKEEARQAYEVTQEALTNMPREHKTLPEVSEGLYLYDMDMQDEEHTLSHLFGMAETLEHFYKDDPEWKKLKEELKYSPASIGTFPGITTEDLEGSPDEYSDFAWPDLEYARDIHNKQVTK